MNKNTYNLVGIGNPVYDEIVTPYISTKGRVLSGCSTNACLIASRLGLKTGLIGCIGEDFLDDFREFTTNLGIDTHVRVSKESGGFHLIYDESGDRELRVLGIADNIELNGESDENSRVNSTAIRKSNTIGNSNTINKFMDYNFMDTDFILFGSILGEISLETIDYVKENSNAKLFLDPQGFIRELVNENGNLNVIHRCDRDRIKEIVSGFDIIKPNEMESKIITGRGPKEACEILYSWGVKIVIITLGEKGSIIFDGDEFHDIPSFETFAKDPTGAGDTYAAGFMFEYLKNNGRNLRKTGLFASSTASVMVENTGPHFTITEDEVRRRVNTLCD